MQLLDFILHKRIFMSVQLTDRELDPCRRLQNVIRLIYQRVMAHRQGNYSCSGGGTSKAHDAEAGSWFRTKGLIHSIINESGLLFDP